MGNYSFSNNYFDGLVIYHEEVLVRPSISSKAIIGLLYFSDLRAFAHDRSLFLQQGYRWIDSIISASLYCRFCMGPRHDHISCQKLRYWQAVEDAIEQLYSIRCSYCLKAGHDNISCERLRDWLAEEDAIERFYRSAAPITCNPGTTTTVAWSS
jgi:hypothetical protein